MKKENLIMLFQELGLTEYEAKTLSALTKLKEVKAPELSRIAEVPKTRIYDVLDDLASKNLVIKLQGRPKRYMAKEPEEVLNILIEEKKKSFAELINNAEKAKDTLKTAKIAEDIGTRILRVKDKNDFIKMVALELQSAENSVMGFAEVLVKHQPVKKVIKNLKEKNVQVKILYPKANELEDLLKQGIDIKPANHGMEAYIVDNKKLIIALTDLKKEGEEYCFAVWNNAPLIEPLRQHFERNWSENKSQ
ncbi:MAG: helix-turn-helix domain-containing protein [Candidatus Diapherotrites archaeon]